MQQITAAYKAIVGDAIIIKAIAAQKASTSLDPLLGPNTEAWNTSQARLAVVEAETQKKFADKNAVLTMKKEDCQVWWWNFWWGNPSWGAVVYVLAERDKQRSVRRISPQYNSSFVHS